MKPLVWRERVLLELMMLFASKLIRMANRREEAGERVRGLWCAGHAGEDLWAM